MKTELDRERRERAVASIRRYLAEEFDEDVGDLKATLFLEFVLEEIGASVYNRALLDARAWIEERLGDLDASLHATEFGYWTGAGRRRRGGER